MTAPSLPTIDDEFASQASGSEQAAEALAAGLHLVATPIGNLGDITLRALTVLRGAGTIACEDTRVTRILLQRYGIAARQLVSYRDDNAERSRPALLAKLEAGESVALVSDAGTPLVSDPGFKLVEACRAAGIAVHALPGASAVLTALLLSGLPPQPFLFAGFAPNRSGGRRAFFAPFAAVPATLVFYESAQRLAESLEDMATVFGDRPAAMTRELTKKFEEVRTGSLRELSAFYAEAGPPRGEIVVVVGPPSAETAPQDVDERLRAALRRHGVKEAAALIAGETGQPRRVLYARALVLAREDGEGDG